MQTLKGTRFVGPVDVTVIINDSIQQSPVVDYFYRSGQFLNHVLNSSLMSDEYLDVSGILTLLVYG